jgi:thiol-disulfide isomerase/thioredoxin
MLIICLGGCYSNTPKLKTGLEGKEMPAIDLILTNKNSHFNTGNIKNGRPTVLFSFEPWCPYCKAQTKSIISHVESLKDIDFIFLTNATDAGLKSFFDRFQLGKYANIKAGIDYSYTFQNYFKTNRVPCMAIYDKEKKLKQVLFGKNYISAIKDIALK